MPNEIELLNFKSISIEQSKMVLKWRNSDIVRNEMVNKSFISYESHKRFIQNLAYDDSKEYFLVISYKPLGIINLTYIDQLTAELGLYKNPDLNKKGVGSILLLAIIDYSKARKLRLLKLKCKKTNSRARFLYVKFKFIVCNEDDEYIYMERTI